MAKRAFLLAVKTKGLQFAEGDIALMRSSLERHDFEIVQPGCTKLEIIDALETFIDGANKTDTLVVYYSGHGITPQGKLQLVLADDVQSVKNRLSIAVILEDVEACKAENKLIILDCCRADTLDGDWHPSQSDRYRILTASERLEQGKEIDELKASFLTYQLNQALVESPAEIAEDDGTIRINALYEWLKTRSKQYNAQTRDRTVPEPNL